MYKIILLFVTFILMLTGCNNDSVGNRNIAEAPNHHNHAQILHTNNLVNHHQEPIQSNQDERITSLPEYKTILEQVGDQGYTFIVETDNDNKREMFLEINGNKQYKTIFTKQTNRLRIINIHETGGEIFNGIISRRSYS